MKKEEQEKKVKLRIPSILRYIDKDEISYYGNTVKEVLNKFTCEYERAKKFLYDEKGELNKFVNIYVNEEYVRFLDKLETKLSEGDTIILIPAIAGG